MRVGGGGGGGGGERERGGGGEGGGGGWEGVVGKSVWQVGWVGYPA